MITSKGIRTMDTKASKGFSTNMMMTVVSIVPTLIKKYGIPSMKKLDICSASSDTLVIRPPVCLLE